MAELPKGYVLDQVPPTGYVVDSVPPPGYVLDAPSAPVGPDPTQAQQRMAGIKEQRRRIEAGLVPGPSDTDRDLDNLSQGAIQRMREGLSPGQAEAFEGFISRNRSDREPGYYNKLREFRDLGRRQLDNISDFDRQKMGAVGTHGPMDVLGEAIEPLSRAGTGAIALGSGIVQGILNPQKGIGLASEGISLLKESVPFSEARAAAREEDARGKSFSGSERLFIRGASPVEAGITAATGETLGPEAAFRLAMLARASLAARQAAGASYADDVADRSIAGRLAAEERAALDYKSMGPRQATAIEEADILRRQAAQARASQGQTDDIMERLFPAHEERHGSALMQDDVALPEAYKNRRAFRDRLLKESARDVAPAKTAQDVPVGVEPELPAQPTAKPGKPSLEEFTRLMKERKAALRDRIIKETAEAGEDVAETKPFFPESKPQRVTNNPRAGVSGLPGEVGRIAGQVVDDLKTTITGRLSTEKARELVIKKLTARGMNPADYDDLITSTVNEIVTVKPPKAFGAAPVPGVSIPNALQRGLDKVSSYQAGGKLFGDPGARLSQGLREVVTQTQDDEAKLLTQFSKPLVQIEKDLGKNAVRSMRSGRLSGILEGRIEATGQEAKAAADVRKLLDEIQGIAEERLGTPRRQDYFPKELTQEARDQLADRQGPLFDLVEKEAHSKGIDINAYIAQVEGGQAKVAGQLERQRVLDLARDAKAADGSFFYVQDDYEALSNYIKRAANRLAISDNFANSKFAQELASKLKVTPNELTTQQIADYMVNEGRGGQAFQDVFANLQSQTSRDAGSRLLQGTLGKIARPFRTARLTLSPVRNAVEGWRPIANEANRLSGGKFGVANTFDEYLRTYAGKNADVASRLEDIGAIQSWADAEVWQPIEGLTRNQRRVLDGLGLGAANRRLNILAGKMSMKTLDHAVTQAKAGDRRLLEAIAKDFNFPEDSIKRMIGSGAGDQDYLKMARQFISNTNPSKVDALKLNRTLNHPLVREFMPFMTMVQAEGRIASHATTALRNGDPKPLAKLLGLGAVTAGASNAIYGALRGVPEQDLNDNLLRIMSMQSLGGVPAEGLADIFTDKAKPLTATSISAATKELMKGDPIRAARKSAPAFDALVYLLTGESSFAKKEKGALGELGSFDKGLEGLE